jgi:hypothetical protein
MKSADEKSTDPKSVEDRCTEMKSVYYCMDCHIQYGGCGLTPFICEKYLNGDFIECEESNGVCSVCIDKSRCTDLRDRLGIRYK